MIFVSAVSAVDMESEDASIETPVVDEEVVSTDVGGGDFSSIKNAMYQSNNISLSGDITRSSSDSEIIIYDGKNISIEGNGHTINANSMGRIFQILPGGKLTLNNLKLVNGNLPSSLTREFDGGAILNMGTLYIVNCEFKNNYARDGGAISCDKHAFTSISGTNVFSNNRVWQDGGAITNGGGSQLYISGKNTFSSNSANYDGTAAIPIDEGKGGAIMNAFDNSYLQITGENIFTNNQAKADGGAIFNHQAIANVSGTNTFSDNRGVYERSKGGCINNENATFYLSGVNTFKSNRAYRGGAIDNSIDRSSFTISGKNEFSSNVACMGGAISNEQSTVLNINGENTFLSNRADYYSGQSIAGSNVGGAIYSYASQLNIDGHNIFTANGAIGPGGAIYSANNNAHIGGVNSFNSNSAPDGGAMLFVDSTRVDLLGENVFDSNTASNTGGAIRANNVNELILTGHNYFSNNRASQSGGAVYTQNSAFNTQGSLYDTNNAIYGGAIFLEKSAFVGNYNIFKNNRATKTGSDIECYQSSINSLEYNYWNSQGKVAQSNINGYSVSNINTWVVLDLTIPSEIKQGESTEIARFKSNSLTNLNGKMPLYTVIASPNFDPSNVVLTENIGKSKYVGPAGQVDVSVSSSNFGASKSVRVINAIVNTTISASDVLLFPNERGTYVATLKDKNGKALSNQIIKVVFNGQTSSLTTDSKGQVSYTVPGLSAGHYTINAVFDGKDNYAKSSKSNDVVVFTNGENNTKITGEDITMFFGANKGFAATLTDMNNNPISGATVKIIIKNTYTRTTKDNGQTNPISLSKLPSGTYEIVSYFVGNDNLLPVSTTNTVVIKSTISGSDIVKYYKNGTQYHATFLKSDGSYLGKGELVNFNINGKIYGRRIADDQGQAIFNINLIPGDYILTAMNPNGDSIANNIKVLTIFSENKDITKYYCNDTNYTVKLCNGDGAGPLAGVQVKFNINGRFYYRTTNDDGVASFNIKLPPKDYIVTAEYDGLRVSNNVKVLSTMSARDVVKKFDEEASFILYLVDGTGARYPGQSVTFNINGVFYPRTTDDEGCAKLKINLPVGQYIITSMYTDSNQNTLSIANTVTVNQ